MEQERSAPCVPASPGCITAGHSALLSALPLSPDALQFDEDDDLEVFSKGEEETLLPYGYIDSSIEAILQKY